MKSLLHKKRKDVSVASISSEFPKLRNGEIAAIMSGGHKKYFCDSFRVNSERVLFGLLEFSGAEHQVLKLLPIVQETFRTGGMQALSSSDINESDAMSGLCLRLNRSLIDAAGPAHSCPAFLGCYNEELGTVCYVRAGQMPGLVRHSSSTSELPATGLPLGLFSHTTLEAGIIALEAGAAMIVVSREIVEAKSRGEQFGLRRVAEVLRNADLISAHDLCVSVIQAAQHYSKRAKAQQLATISLTRSI